jgi:hypothetical protein
MMRTDVMVRSLSGCPSGRDEAAAEGVGVADEAIGDETSGAGAVQAPRLLNIASAVSARRRRIRRPVVLSGACWCLCETGSLESFK